MTEGRESSAMSYWREKLGVGKPTDALSSKKGSRVRVKLRSGQALEGLLKRVEGDEIVIDVNGAELVVFKQAADAVQLL